MTHSDYRSPDVLTTSRQRTGKVRSPRAMGKENYEKACFIYFIEAVGMGLIKIGYALDPNQRFWTMVTASPAPLSMLGVLPGGPQREKQIHQQLDAHRLHGEWFKKVPEVMAVVATSAKDFGQDMTNQVARRRGEALMEYLAKMKRGEVVRPTRGKLRRPKSLNPKGKPYRIIPLEPTRSEMTEQLPELEAAFDMLLSKREPPK